MSKNAFVQIRDHILRQTLRKYIWSYKTHEYYPVVVGGLNINRCLSIHPRSKDLVDAMFSSDIDLDFVVTSHIDANDHEPVIFKEIVKRRQEMFDKIVNDQELKDYIKQVEGKTKTQITLVIDNHAMENKSYRVYKMRLSQIKITISGFQTTLLDSPIYANNNTEDYKVYKRFFEKPEDLKNPIPFVNIDGVPYATCNFIYYDNVRMLYYYNRVFIEAQKKKDVKWMRFYFVKSLRYLVKFCALYVMMNAQISDRKAQELHTIYSQAKMILPDTSSALGIPKENIKLYNTLLKKLTNRRLSNIAELQKVIEGASTPNRHIPLKNTRL